VTSILITEELAVAESELTATEDLGKTVWYTVPGMPITCDLLYNTPTVSDKDVAYKTELRTTVRFIPS
jgi:hypothetical protein